MTPQIALALFILAMAILFIVTEWIPLGVLALLVLGTFAITGLVTPAEALYGFSSPAVVTGWVVFILPYFWPMGGSSRTGLQTVPFLII